MGVSAMMAFGTLRKEQERALKPAELQKRVQDDCRLLKQAHDAKALVMAWPENDTKVWMLSTLSNRIVVLQDNVRRHAISAATAAKAGK